MNPAIIRNRLRKGFRPFVINLSNGERIEVRRPLRVAVIKDIIILLGKDGWGRVIDGARIESVYDLQAVSPTKSVHLQRIRARFRNGFKPFRIRLADGRKFDVPRLGCMAVGRDVVVYLDKNDMFNRIDAHQIVSVEDLPETRRARAPSRQERKK